MEVLYNSSILWGVKKGCCTDSRFTTDFTTDADKNMQKYADICKNTCCKSVEQPFINQEKSREIANDKSTIRMPRQHMNISS